MPSASTRDLFFGSDSDASAVRFIFDAGMQNGAFPATKKRGRNAGALDRIFFENALHRKLSFENDGETGAPPLEAHMKICFIMFTKSILSKPAPLGHSVPTPVLPFSRAAHAVSSIRVLSSFLSSLRGVARPTSAKEGTTCRELYLSGLHCEGPRGDNEASASPSKHQGEVLSGSEEKEDCSARAFGKDQPLSWIGRRMQPSLACSSSDVYRAACGRK
eukprot:scaffold1505_cov256-Pinguiococcus_pyrenoidosus.AAC.2